MSDLETNNLKYYHGIGHHTITELEEMVSERNVLINKYLAKEIKMKLYSERLADAKSTYAAGLKSVADTSMPEGQKFAPETFVLIADDLGSHMSHFKKGVYAKVEYTYAHAYGGDDVESYCLLVRLKENDWTEVSWYEESQLTEVTDPEVIKRLEKEIKKDGN